MIEAVSSRERGFSLLETTIGVGVLALAAILAFGATHAGAGAIPSPVVRDRALAAMHDVAVEVRAAVAYDSAAIDAIRRGGTHSWELSDRTRMTTQVSGDGNDLIVTATAGNQTLRARYPLVREALPQGAIVDPARP